MVYTGKTGLPVSLRYLGKNKMIHWLEEKFNPDTIRLEFCKAPLWIWFQMFKLMILQEKSSFAGMEY